MIVGVGSIGERHLRCFSATDRCELSLVEINSELRQHISEKYGISARYDTLEAALRHSCKAAVIATPTHLHVGIAIACAKAGIHLLIEKPLSVGLERVSLLSRVIRDNDIRAMIAYIHRSNPALVAMKAAINSGRFGKPVQVISHAGQHFPTYRPAYCDIYFSDRKTGGGLVQDGLTHQINTGEWLVGPTTRVAAAAEHFVLEGVEVEDTVQVLARHGSVMATYSGNLHQAPNESSITVVCESATARFVGHLNQWQWMTDPDSDWQIESFDVPDRDTLFVNQANTFLDFVEGRCEPSCSLEEGVHTLKANLAILESSDGDGGFVQVDS